MVGLRGILLRLLATLALSMNGFLPFVLTFYRSY